MKRTSTISRAYALCFHHERIFHQLLPVEHIFLRIIRFSLLSQHILCARSDLVVFVCVRFRVYLRSVRGGSCKESLMHHLLCLEIFYFN